MRSAIHFDFARGRFVYPVGGPGDPVIETDTLEQMEAFLDDHELRVQADAAATRIQVLLRKVKQCWYSHGGRTNHS